MRKILFILALLSAAVLADCDQVACLNQAEKAWCSPGDSACVFSECGFFEESDADGDSWTDSCDAFPQDASEQVDYDADGCGHNSDIDDLDHSEVSGCEVITDDDDDDDDDDTEDTDEDGIEDESDNCPTVANPDQADNDGDGLGDACDNCPSTSNPDQANADADGTGDACEVVEKKESISSGSGGSGLGTGICMSRAWRCGEWSACEEGTQTRTCDQINFDCKGDENKPKESQTCEMPVEEVIQTQDQQSEETEEETQEETATVTPVKEDSAGLSGITGNVIDVPRGEFNPWILLPVFLGGLLLIFLFFRKKN